MKILVAVYLLLNIALANSFAAEIEPSVEEAADDVKKTQKEGLIEWPVGENQKPTVIRSDKVSTEVLHQDFFRVYLEVRDSVTNGFVPIYQKASKTSAVVGKLYPGDIIVSELSGRDLVDRDRFEKEDRGSWLKVKVQSLQNSELTEVYVWDHWKNFLTLENSSRGVSLEVRQIKNKLRVVKDLGQINNFNCDLPEIYCFLWKEEFGYIYANDIILAEGKSGGLRPRYFARFVKPEDGEERWARGWIEGEHFQRRIDTPSCIRKRCISHHILTSNPEDMRGLFVELGLIQRPKLKIPKADQTFAVTSAFVAGENGEVPFNRWLAKLEKEKENNPPKEDDDDYGVSSIKKKTTDEIAYLFQIRPVFEGAVGAGYYSLKQTGDLGDHTLSEFGITGYGTMVFPIFVDFEMHLIGEILLPLVSDAKGSANYIVPFNVTSDLLWVFSANESLTYNFGLGGNFRSMFSDNTDVGVKSLFGIHLTSGFYSQKYFGYMQVGLAGRDFNSNSSDIEWSLTLGMNFIDIVEENKIISILRGMEVFKRNRKSAKSKEKTQSAFLRLSGYTLNREEEDVFTEVVSNMKYQVLQATINYSWEL